MYAWWSGTIAHLHATSPAAIVGVPEGNAKDQTRSPGEFDAIAAYLIDCGAAILPRLHSNAQPQPAPADPSL